MSVDAMYHQHARRRRARSLAKGLLLAFVGLVLATFLGYALLWMELTTTANVQRAIWTLPAQQRFSIDIWHNNAVMFDRAVQTRAIHIRYAPADFATAQAALAALDADSSSDTLWHVSARPRLFCLTFAGSIVFFPAPFDDAAFFLAAAIVGGLGLIWLLARRLLRPTPPPGLYCAACGYATPNTLRKCPECGCPELRVHGGVM